MAYSDIALLESDTDFRQRIRACASTEGVDDPVTWSNDHSWEIAGTPSFGDKYASALAAGVPRPGNDQSVINDGEILSAVQPLIGT